MLGLKGLATGIGSMPHTGIGAQDAALQLIFKYCPYIPFWPQLPKQDIYEGMIVQFSENFPCLSQPNLGFRSKDKEKELEIFYEKIINQDIDYFKISPTYARGLDFFYKKLNQELGKFDLKDIKFIKCQITGPFTFGASIKDEKDVALLHDSIYMQVIIKGLTMKALWQIRRFKKFGKKIIMFLDEPYLGCFGSAYTPINRKDVIDGLTEFTQGIKSGDVLLGVHCCGNTDWSIFTDINSIDIISFDAFGFLDKFVLYTDNLRDFFKRGGIVCWGVVPTQEFTGRETAELLLDKLKEGINALVKKGVDKDLLSENLLISPSCGLGSLDTERAEKIFRILHDLSSLIKK